MDTTEKRLKAIEQLLNWEIGFKIHNVINGRYYVDDIFPKLHERSCTIATYPYSWEFYGNSYGGSYRSIKDAAKIILKLIRDNHDVTIQDIWDQMSIHPNKKGHIVVLMFPESEELYKYESVSGAFFSNVSDEILDFIDDEEKQKKGNADSIISQICNDVPGYQQLRKISGQWDTDDDLSLEPKIDKNRSVYIKDIIAVLKADDEKSLMEKYINHPEYKAFLFDKEVPEYIGDDYGDSRRDTSALISCAYANSHKCMKLILEHKANPNYQNEGGSTALHIAGRYGYIECVKLLLEHNADISLKDNDDVTAHERCLIRGKTECAELIKSFQIE